MTHVTRFASWPDLIGRQNDSSSDGVLIAEDLRVLGLAQRFDRAWVFVIEFKSVTGQWTKLLLPRDEPLAAAAFGRLLARVGYASLADRRELSSLANRLRQLENLPILRLAYESGWTADCKAYLFGDRIIGKQDGTVILPPDLDQRERLGLLSLKRSNGSSKAWKRALAECEGQSSLLIFSVCAGLAGVMVGPLAVESGMFHIHGLSGAGKTTLLMGARSPFGPCDRDLLPNWDATETGAEELIETCADSPFVFDELTLESDNREAALRVRRFVYRVSSGRGRKRSRHWTGGEEGKIRRGRLLVLSNGEVSLEHVAQRLGERRRGEVVRAIDIHAGNAEGLGVFDEVPETVTPEELLKKLERAFLANYGRAGYRFVEALISQGDDWPQTARRRMARFMERAKVPSTTFERRFAERFALVYAAGLAAAETHIVPWSKEEIGKAVRCVYRRARSALPDSPKSQAEAIESLRQALRRHFDSSADTSRSAASGTVLRHRDREYGDLILVDRAHMRILCGGEQACLSVIQALIRSGDLIPGREDAATRQVRIKGAAVRPRYCCLRASFIE
jgi:hypothetical protein